MFQVFRNPVGDPLQKQVSGTYHTLRWGIAFLAVVFPFVLWWGGRLKAGLPLQSSMSAYYYAGPAGAVTGTMRDWFVGLLFALAAPMYLYKGFTPRENRLLNVASILAVGVAIFPMSWPPNSGGSSFSLHGACAICAFLCLALVAWLCPKDSLKYMENVSKRSHYKRIYLFTGIFMAGFPILAWVLTTFFGKPGKLVFWTEALGLLGFAAYWTVKSLEMLETQGEVKALRGELPLS